MNPSRTSTVPTQGDFSGIKTGRTQLVSTRDGWHRSLADAIRDPDELIEILGLPDELKAPARQASSQFPLLATRSFIARIRHHDPTDPLLQQVLPLRDELDESPGFMTDAVGDTASRKAPGLLHKYPGRALLIATGACAVHCRYCFRRHYPYELEPRRLEDWTPALEALNADTSIREVLLSGGDPLMLTDVRLGELIERLSQISHLKRLRIHSRLPIVLPDRITTQFLNFLRNSRLTPIMVVHANHPNEVAGDCEDALRVLVQAGITTLNQAVLLRGVNDCADVLEQLCERLINVGVIPYYLHQLDKVQGTAHFEVDDARATALMKELRRRLPGYAVPRLVREEAGSLYKTPL